MKGKEILLDGEVVLVLSTAALGYPKHNRRKHQPDVLRDVTVTVVLVHFGIVVQDVLEDQDALEGVGHALDACIRRKVGKRFQGNVRREALTTLPARPPAIKAKLINKKSLALQTALESPNPSSPRTRSLSIKLTIDIPRREQIPGIQSTNVTCTSTGSVSCGG